MTILVYFMHAAAKFCAGANSLRGQSAAAQGQANKWLKQCYAASGLEVVDATTPNLLQHLQTAIETGVPILLEVCPLMSHCDCRGAACTPE